MGVDVIRSVWLDEEVGLRDRPPGARAKLHGVYDEDSGMVTISVIIEYNGTEYRTIRVHKEVNRFKENTTERLKYLHRNMVSHFLKRFRLADFATVVRKFLRWSSNQTHWDVLGKFTPPIDGAEKFVRALSAKEIMVGAGVPNMLEDRELKLTVPE